MKIHSILSIFIMTTFVSCTAIKHNEIRIIIDSPKSADYYLKDNHEMCSEALSVKKRKNFAAEKSSNIFQPVRELASEESLLDLAENSDCKDITTLEIKEIIETIKRLGGQVVNPMDYTNNVEGLKKFMTASGVSSYFNASDMITPNHPRIAKDCGLDDLLPPRCRWLSGAIQGIIASKLYTFINKESQGHDISLRNWWRPACYNKQVEGAAASDHIQARGFDLDFETPEERAIAQNHICQFYKEKPFNLQIGIGCNTLHVGVGSPKRLDHFPKNGSRFWTYGSLNGCSAKRLKTDDCWVMDEKGNKFIHSPDLTAKEGAL